MDDPAISGGSGGRSERAIATVHQYASSGVNRQGNVAAAAARAEISLILPEA
jgi:hypothetical protein